MKPIVADVLVDLILEDVMNDGHLFEANPYHDAAGKFTSKGAADLYQAGALAFGRAKGLKAKVQGLDREGIRAAIKGGIEQHLAKQGDREAGQTRLGLVRKMAAKGTLPPAPKPKAAREPREKAAPKAGKIPGNENELRGAIGKALAGHKEATRAATHAELKVVAKVGPQVQARAEWQGAHKDLEKIGERVAKLTGALDKVVKAQRPDDDIQAKSPRIQAEPPKAAKAGVDYSKMKPSELTRTLKDLETEHAKHGETIEKARAGLRGQATHSKAGLHYAEMENGRNAQAQIQKRMKIVRDELKKRGA